jgi:ABC-type spermidine/putrescine transport system permease subunit I
VKGRGWVVGIATAALIPVLGLLLLVLWMGFWQNGPGEPVVYTLAHYRKIFSDPFTYKTFLNTVGFAATAVLVALLFAVPTAWLVERTDLPGKNLILMLVTLGALLPTFFTAMGWVFLLHPRIGIVNRFFIDLFALDHAPLNIASIVGMGWVEGLGLSSIAFIMVVATYRAMDPSLEEAARVHGLGILRTLRYVTLPLTFPGIIAAAIYVFTIALSAFEVPAIIGMSNKIFTFSTFIFYKIQPLEELPSYGVAGAVSTVLIILALLLSWSYFGVLRFSHRYAVVTGSLPAAPDRAWPDGLGARVALSRVLFRRRQTAAFSAPDLGGTVALFSAAIVGGFRAGLAQQFLRTALEAAATRRVEYFYSHGCRADGDAVHLPGDFLDGAALRSALAADFRRRRVSSACCAASDSCHCRDVRNAVSAAQCFVALRQPGSAHFCLHGEPDQLCHAHHQ